MKDKIFGVLQRVGRSFMLPVAVLPVAGLLLGLGSSFTNKTTLATYNLLGIMGPGTMIYNILTIMSKCGSVIFDNLPLIFAVGVAIGMAKKEKEVAALASMIAFLVMHSAISGMITIYGGPEAFLTGATGTVLGMVSLQMGAFGGIIVGLGVAALHNKFYKIELPAALAFFQGTRFVPIISTVVFLFVGILMFYIWQPVQVGINNLGGVVQSSGVFGTFLYGMIKRLLIPFGLHHVFYMPFWQTAIGGTMEIAGHSVVGAQNIFFAQLADPTTTHFSTLATRFFSGEFIIYIFGLPGAALAIYRCARPEKKKAVYGLLFSAAITSIMTGITEPLEFSFLFVAPLLFGINAILAGLAYAIAQALNIAVGLTFSGGFIDLFMFGILQGNSKTSWLLIIPVGIVYFAVYYFLFSYLIKKLNLKTPGREEDSEETKLYTRADYNKKKNATIDNKGNEAEELSAAITQGLGGKANISDVDCCATRLRITVIDGNKVKEDILKSTGAAGVIHKGTGVQVIYGPKVTIIKSNLEDYLETEDATIEKVVTEPKRKMSTDKETIEKQEIVMGQETIIYAPLSGNVMELSEIKDGVFSEEMLGKGFVIDPTEGKVVAPCDCKVETIFDTKHAIGLSCGNIEILIHIGIDTVQLNGKGYDIKVREGDVLKKGDVIGYFDIKAITDLGYRVVTPVTITNTSDFTTIKLLKKDSIKAGEEILSVQ
ncbi:PTS transporter subunit IIABC [[Clostridium] fimetarium]|uniref:PTS system, D-glucosamine-specific IIC component n=1 Tax=[Clostridium] fimetarium TaxID=99656 RepID=A0A1I0MEA7_9FIRM|nr:PTS transporter subunit IIABC [[Clostridium] fimetarium]SEV85761.1 PTS system, D-glucosamine-specific IIC component [[Clostridium] fimetarium]